MKWTLLPTLKMHLWRFSDVLKGTQLAGGGDSCTQATCGHCLTPPCLVPRLVLLPLWSLS